MIRSSQFAPFRFGSRRPRAAPADMVDREKACLALISGRIQESGVPPSFEELRKALRLTSKHGVHRLIRRLEARGKIKCLPRRARAIAVIGQPAHMAMVPHHVDMRDPAAYRHLVWDDVQKCLRPLARDSEQA